MLHKAPMETFLLSIFDTEPDNEDDCAGVGIPVL